MFPVFLDLGFFKIHTYGVMIVCGFLLAIWLLKRKAERLSLDIDKLMDMSFWVLLMGMVGGRVLYVATTWDQFSNDFAAIFKFWEGGLVFYGGFIGGAGASFYFIKKYQFPFFATIDMLVPSLSIGHFFGRIGCFAAGCCYGKPIDASSPFAVIFSNPECIAPLGVHLHASQLYDAANALVIFLALQLLYAKKSFDGQVAAIYCMLYAVGRSIVEEFRGDSVRGFVIDGVLSTSQFISIFTFLFGVGLYVYGLKNKNKPSYFAIKK